GVGAVVAWISSVCPRRAPRTIGPDRAPDDDSARSSSAREPRPRPSVEAAGARHLGDELELLRRRHEGPRATGDDARELVVVGDPLRFGDRPRREDPEEGGDLLEERVDRARPTREEVVRGAAHL